MQKCNVNKITNQLESLIGALLSQCYLCSFLQLWVFLFFSRMFFEQLFHFLQHYEHFNIQMYLSTSFSPNPFPCFLSSSILICYCAAKIFSLRISNLSVIFLNTLFFSSKTRLSQCISKLILQSTRFFTSKAKSAQVLLDKYKNRRSLFVISIFASRPRSLYV